MLNKRRKVGRQPVLSTQRSCGGEPDTGCAVLRSVLAVAPNKNKDFHCEGVAGPLFVLFLDPSLEAPRPLSSQTLHGEFGSGVHGFFLVWVFQG